MRPQPADLVSRGLAKELTKAKNDLENPEIGTAVAEVVVPSECPLCGKGWEGSRVRQVTVLADPSDPLAGTRSFLGIKHLSYGQCSACGSYVALDGRRDPSCLANAYEEVDQSYWQNLNRHSQFATHLENQIMPLAIGRDLWDVGCGDGLLLSSLSGHWRKHGIEPGNRGVAEARQKGLEVLHGTASTLKLQNVADVVLMVDVAEHLLDPDTEMLAIEAMLRPGGLLAVFTGCADALTARIAGTNWYYLSCVGHVSIFTRRALNSVMTGSGLQVLTADRVPHDAGVTAIRWLRRLAGNLLRTMRREPRAAMPLFRDHQLVIARKREN